VLLVDFFDRDIAEFVVAVKQKYKEKERQFILNSNWAAEVKAFVDILLQLVEQPAERLIIETSSLY
jgi:hypothetical protein